MKGWMRPLELIRRKTKRNSPNRKWENWWRRSKWKNNVTKSPLLLTLSVWDSTKWRFKLEPILQLKWIIPTGFKLSMSYSLRRGKRRREKRRKRKRNNASIRIKKKNKVIVKRRRRNKNTIKEKRPRKISANEIVHGLPKNVVEEDILHHQGTATLNDNFQLRIKDWSFKVFISLLFVPSLFIFSLLNTLLFHNKLFGLLLELFYR